jgi:hypothetical protein
MKAWDVALYTLARLLSWSSRGRVRLLKYYFLAQPVPDGLLLPPQRGRDIVVQRVRADHPLIASLPRPAPVVARRFRDGAACFLATKNGALVGFLWLQAPIYDEDEVRSRFVPLPEGRTVWDFDVHLEEAHRASFAFARLWDAANAHLRECGVAWSVSRVSAFNPMSLHSHRRLGARRVGSAVYVSGRRWQLTVSDLRPRLHFSRDPNKAPRIELHADR